MPKYWWWRKARIAWHFFNLISLTYFCTRKKTKTDIDECQNPASCGSNALCQNTPGNFTCTCPNGYGGNPYDGVCLFFFLSFVCLLPDFYRFFFKCADIDECELGNACGTGSICTNTDGGYKCACPPGFSGDPKVACIDVDECAPPPPGVKSTPVCGRSAICDNLPGTFRCQCPPGFKGDPKVACEGSKKKKTFFYSYF